MKIETISPHGFCGGVERAIRMAHELLDRTGGTVYGLHEIVHNETVVNALTSKGMVFVESVSEVPEGATVLVSAHGTSPATFALARERGLKVVDATCPFVSAGHARIRENFRKGMRTVVIGNPAHAEVLGYLGEEGACLPEEVRPGERTGTVVQTTLDAGEHEGVCTATRDRQQAVREFVSTMLQLRAEARRYDIDRISEASRKKIHSPLSTLHSPLSKVGVLVVGSVKSSNTGKLADIAERVGAKVWRIAGAEEVPGLYFGGIEVLGVTSGASTPEDVYEAVLDALRNVFDGEKEDQE